MQGHWTDYISHTGAHVSSYYVMSNDGIMLDRQTVQVLQDKWEDLKPEDLPLMLAVLESSNKHPIFSRGPSGGLYKAAILKALEMGRE